MAIGSSTSASTLTRPAWSPRSAAVNCSRWLETPVADSTVPRTQEQRRADAERRLVRAAAELVGEIGPAKVTLANVGERAGYSRGLATHHFGEEGAQVQRLLGAFTSQSRVPMSYKCQTDSRIGKLGQ